MADVFISYTHNDEAWAEWIAWVLEEAGYTCVLQKWDFRPGGNFVLEMQQAAAHAERTVAVLSADYLKSTFAAPEWAAAFARDPSGVARKLVPVRVQAVDAEGLLGTVVYIDLLGKSEEEAKQEVLAGLRTGRAKPLTPPRFPGHEHPARPFPGPATPVARRAGSPLRIRRPPTDLEKRRFVRAGFNVIANVFQTQLAEAEEGNRGVETNFELDGTTAFRGEVYVDGKLRANCRIWLGGMHGENGISYAEGSTANMGNATNDTLSVAHGDELAFSALMDVGVGQRPPGIDTRRMTATDAAEYLWSRFLWRLT